MLGRAHHLHTQCSPTIYYRPYVLLPEQNAIIEEQLVEAQAQIDADNEGTTLKRREESTPPAPSQNGDDPVEDEG
jgi:hypothetical protein